MSVCMGAFLLAAGAKGKRVALKHSRIMIHQPSGGARGTLWASMVATGNEHGLGIRIYGENGCLQWRHEDAAHLSWRAADGTERILSAAQPGISEEASAASRLSWGHPEGFFECFANLYREIADAIDAHRAGGELTDRSFPSVWDGVLGVRFVEAVSESQRKNGAWVNTGLSP